MAEKTKFEEPLIQIIYFTLNDVVLASDTDGQWKWGSGEWWQN